MAARRRQAPQAGRFGFRPACRPPVQGEGGRMKAQYLSEIMDDLGVSKFTVKVLVVVGVAMAFDGFDYMIVSYTMPQIAAEWGLDSV